MAPTSRNAKYVLTVLCAITLALTVTPSSSGSTVAFVPDLQAETTFCPYNCSGHGQCAASGVCACSSPWNGPACAYRLYPVEAGVTTEYTSAAAEWVYFSISIPSNKNYLIPIVSHTNSCYPDLYARARTLPQINGYDAAVIGDQSDLVITAAVVNPLVGSWYFGVVCENTACSYSFEVRVDSLCPNNCSQHGHCELDTGKCICDEHWRTREDCSLKLQDMQLGEIYYGESYVSDFVYYKVTLSLGNRIDIELTMTESNTTIPTITYDYVARSAFAPPHQLVSITINNPLPGDLYIGVYGNVKFEYQVSAHASIVCPNQCSNNGNCSPRGECICGLYYKREDCSLFVMGPLPVPTNLPAQVADSVASYSWRYFNLTLATQKDMKISLVASDGADMSFIELYVRISASGELPTTETYDKKTRCSPAMCGFLLLRQSPGYFVVGVRLNDTIDGNLNYQLSYVGLKGCPNGCNSHGSCGNDGRCHCKPGWNGDDCSQFIEEIPNSIHVQTKGTIGTGSPLLAWRYFSIDINTENNLLIQFNRTGPLNSNGTLIKMHTGLYLRKGSLPTQLDYLRARVRSSEHSNFMQIAMQGTDITSPGTYYLGIFIEAPSIPGGGSMEATYWVAAQWDRICPRNCSKHGECIDGQCICESPYIAPDCSAQDLPIPTNLELKGKVTFDVWNYYHLTVLGEDALEVIVQEQESIIAGRVWVFVKMNGIPTIDDNDGGNQSTSVMHTVFIPSVRARGNWTIGVTGSPRNSGSNPFSNVASYSILALTGCGTYSDCGKCVVDPNCGWCRNEPFNPAAGQCVPGTPLQPSNQTCLYYNFNTCDVGNSSEATIRGLIIGVIVGVVFLLGIGIAIFFIWREQKRQDKEFMRPVIRDFDGPEELQRSATPPEGSPVQPGAISRNDYLVGGSSINDDNDEAYFTPQPKNYGAIPIRKRESFGTPEGYSSVLGKNTQGVYTDEDDDDHYGDYASSDSEGDDNHQRFLSPAIRGRD